LRDATGKELIATAEAVIDATGTYGNHNWVGAAGIPAPGEQAAAEAIEYGLPDVLGRDRQHYAGKKVLVVGAGYSAATTVVALAALAREVPGTEIVWITRQPAASKGGPIRIIENDRLATRDRLASEANALSAGESSNVDYLPGMVVERIERSANGRLAVGLSGGSVKTIEVDRIVANVGYRPDNRLYAELQVHECYATGGPLKLAAALLGNRSADCLDQTPHGPSSLYTPEPDFYILGAKSYGRNSQFLLSVGLAQIRDLFSILGDRADLDLYRTMGALAQ
jgi:hypothetical protein